METCENCFEEFPKLTWVCYNTEFANMGERYCSYDCLKGVPRHKLKPICPDCNEREIVWDEDAKEHYCEGCDGVFEIDTEAM